MCADSVYETYEQQIEWAVTMTINTQKIFDVIILINYAHNTECEWSLHKYTLYHLCAVICDLSVALDTSIRINCVQRLSSLRTKSRRSSLCFRYLNHTIDHSELW